MFIRELKRFKNLNKDFRGIVFCGNDRAEEEEDNKHCRDIERELNKQAPKLRTQIVTGTDKKAAKLIEAFRNDCSCDILIVKQMGGVGLDIEDLKVELDLSTVRTFVATAQKWLRIATIHPLTRIGRLIAPADIRATSRFEEIVTNNGGSYETRPTASTEWITEYEAEDKPSKPSIFLVLEAEWFSTNDDRLREFRDDRIRQIVDDIMTDAPLLVGLMTEPSLAEILENRLPSFSDQEETVPVDQSRDITKSRELLCYRVRERIKDIVQIYCPYKKDDPAYKDAMAAEWTLAKKRAGLEGKYSSIQLKYITDEDDLRRLIEVADARYMEMKYGGL